MVRIIRICGRKVTTLFRKPFPMQQPIVRKGSRDGNYIWSVMPYENVGMFIPAGLSDEGHLYWEAQPDIKFPVECHSRCLFQVFYSNHVAGAVCVSKPVSYLRHAHKRGEWSHWQLEHNHGSQIIHLVLAAEWLSLPQTCCVWSACVYLLKSCELD